MPGPIGGWIVPQGGGGTGGGGAPTSLTSGAVTSGFVGDAAVVSGSIASGQIGKFHFSSGATIDSAEWLIEDTFTAGEILSGATIISAVCFSQSGTVIQARAAVSGRMPAVGVITANVASGALATVYRGGRLFSPSMNFSGWMNQPLYVGRSGQVIASGAPNSSGDVQQIVGVSIQQSGMMVQLGDALEEVIAGSGDVGSGAITGAGAAGYLCVASGSLGANDIGSGSIRSGHTGSGGYAQNWSVGTTWNCAEAISGLKAVALNSTGQYVLAMAGSGLRLPAIGVTPDAVTSGAIVRAVMLGNIDHTSCSGWSGFNGKLLYVGSGGAVVTQSGLLSGMAWQKLGIAYSGGIQVCVDLSIFSGAVTAPTNPATLF